MNGAGKTTTIKMLSCLTQPTSGDAFLNGKSICKDTAAVKSLIAVSPQETAVAPGLSAQENLALMCGVHGFTKEKRNTKVTELTKLLGLELVIIIALVSFLIKTGVLSAVLIGIKKIWEWIRNK